MADNAVPAQKENDQEGSGESVSSTTHSSDNSSSSSVSAVQRVISSMRHATGMLVPESLSTDRIEQRIYSIRHDMELLETVQKPSQSTEDQDPLQLQALLEEAKVRFGETEREGKLLERLLYARTKDLQQLEQEKALRSTAATNRDPPVSPAATARKSKVASKSASMPAGPAKLFPSALSQDDSEDVYVTMMSDAKSASRSQRPRSDKPRMCLTSPAALSGELKAVTAKKQCLADHLAALVQERNAAFDELLIEVEQLCQGNEHMRASLQMRAAQCKRKDTELAAICRNILYLDQESVQIVGIVAAAADPAHKSGQEAITACPQRVNNNDCTDAELSRTMSQSVQTDGVTATCINRAPLCQSTALPLITCSCISSTSQATKDMCTGMPAQSQDDNVSVMSAGQPTYDQTSSAVCVHEAQVHRLIVETDQLKIELWKLHEKLTNQEIEIGSYVGQNCKRDVLLKQALVLLSALRSNCTVTTDGADGTGSRATIFLPIGTTDIAEHLDALEECLAAAAQEAVATNAQAASEPLRAHPAARVSTQGGVSLPEEKQLAGKGLLSLVAYANEPPNQRGVAAGKVVCSSGNSTTSKLNTTMSHSPTRMATTPASDAAAGVAIQDRQLGADLSAEVRLLREQLYQSQSMYAGAVAEAGRLKLALSQCELKLQERQHGTQHKSSASQIERQLAEKDAHLAEVLKQLAAVKAELQCTRATISAETQQHSRQLQEKDARLAQMSGELGRLLDLIEAHRSAAGSGTVEDTSASGTVSGTSRTVMRSASSRVTEKDAQLSSLADENVMLKEQIADLIARMKNVDFHKYVEHRAPGSSSSWHVTSTRVALTGMNSVAVTTGGRSLVNEGSSVAASRQSPANAWSDRALSKVSTTRPLRGQRALTPTMSKAARSSSSSTNERSQNSSVLSSSDSPSTGRNNKRSYLTRQPDREHEMHQVQPDSYGTQASGTQVETENVAHLVRLRDEEIVSLKDTIAELQRQLHRARSRSPSPAVVRQSRATGRNDKASPSVRDTGLLAIMTEDNFKMKRHLQQVRAESAATSAKLREKQAKISELQTEMKRLQLTAAPKEVIDSCMMKIKQQERELTHLHEQLQAAMHQGCRPSTYDVEASGQPVRLCTQYSRQLEVVTLEGGDDERIRELRTKLDEQERRAFDLEDALCKLKDSKQSLQERIEQLRADRAGLRAHVEELQTATRTQRAETERVQREYEERLKQARSECESQRVAAIRREAGVTAELEAVRVELRTQERELVRLRQDAAQQQAVMRTREEEAAQWKAKAEDGAREMRDADERYGLALRAKVKEVCDLQEQCGERAREAAAARAGTDKEVHALRAELAEQRRLREDTAEQSAMLLKLKEDETGRLYKDLGCLMAKAQSMAREHEIQVNQMRSEILKAQSEKETFFADCSETLRGKQADIRRLTSSVEQFELEVSQLKRSQDEEIAQLRADYESRLERASAEQSAAVAANERDIAAARAEIERLCTELRSNDAAAANLRCRLKEVESDCLTVTAAEEKARKECERLGDDIDREHRKCIDLEALVAQLSNEFDRRMVNAARSHAADLEGRDARIRELCGRVERIARERGDMSTELHSALQAKEQEKGALVQRCAALEAALRCAQQDYAARLRKKKGEIKSLRDEIRHMGEEGMRLLQLREREIVVMKTHLSHLLQLIDKPRRRTSAGSRGSGKPASGPQTNVPHPASDFNVASVMDGSSQRAPTGSSFLLDRNSSDVTKTRIDSVDLVIKALPKIVVSPESQKKHSYTGFT